MGRRRSFTLRDLLFVALKNRALVVTVFCAAVAVSLIYCIVTPPVYRAETTLVIRVAKTPLLGLDQYRPDSYAGLSFQGSLPVRHEIEILEGEYLTEKVLSRLKGRVEPLRTGRTPITEMAGAIRASFRAVLSSVGLWTGPTDPEKQLVLTFLDSLHITPLKDTEAVSISFDWTDPRFAALVANAYADEYATQYTLADESRRLAGFYADRTGLLAEKLKETEERYQSFLSRSNIADMALQKELLLRNIAEISNRISLAETDIAQAQAKEKRTREMMRKQKEWLEADSLLDKAAMELALAQSRKTSLLRQLSTERKKLDGINARTVGLAQLEREKAIAEENYRTQLRKTEDLRVSEDLDTKKISNVKVAIPAVPPATHFHPNRGLVVLLSAIGGLLFGLVLSGVKKYFDHTFQRDKDVFDVLDVPLLLSVPFQAHGNADAEVKQGRSNTGANRLRKLFGQEFRRPLAENGTLRNGSAIVLCVALAAVPLLYFFKSLPTSPHLVMEPGMSSRARLDERVVSLSTVYPTGPFNERKPVVVSEGKSQLPELWLLSDELEGQRRHLEKKRGQLEDQLRKVRPE
jgi:polysaccharide biosynthesis transport protein